MQTGEVKEERDIHEKQINDIKMSPDGTHFITASSDKTAKLVDTQTLEVSCLSCHGGSCHLHVLGGNLCVPCCGDGRVVLPESPVGLCVHSASFEDMSICPGAEDLPIRSAHQLGRHLPHLRPHRPWWRSGGITSAPKAAAIG
jgi:WD40 repeat protein